MIDKSSLPVGSCVKVINCSKMVMIAGYIPYDNQEKKLYDYIGIYVPLGIRKSRKSLELSKDYIYLNSSDIEKIIFMGFSDDKSQLYQKYLLNIKSKLSNVNIDDLSEEMVNKLLKDSLPNVKNTRNEV